MRVLHVSTAVNVGGSEVMMRRLVEVARRQGVVQEVVSLADIGPVGRDLQRLGFAVHALGMKRTAPNPLALLELVRIIRAFRPDVVQTWMYHADLLGGVAARLAGYPKVFWCIQNGTLDARTSRRTTRWTVAACARASHTVPDGIVCVSRVARDLHISWGYDASRFVVIPNGVDVDEFHPDPAGREEVRRELGLPEQAIVVGLIARVDPQKDHATFVKAAALLATSTPQARFLLCGDGATRENADLVGRISAAGLLDRFLLLGRRDDVARLVRAVDLATLSSAYGEAFPLAIGEAMACGVPCVVTDLGDCAHLVGDTGRVVPPRDAAALAGAWQALADLGVSGRLRLGVAARARVAALFSLPSVVEQYATLYRQAVDGAPEQPARPSAVG
jgi:glycosyltransferase involved in cell wall biosynthesis